MEDVITMNNFKTIILLVFAFLAVPSVAVVQIYFGGWFSIAQAIMLFLIFCVLYARSNNERN